MLEHQKYMERCLQLSALGMGSVSPNPMVGAVIVCDNKIIGEGYHMMFGEAHAEVNAINDVLDKHQDAESLLRRSTIYVSLEPCSHFGKTPPCADLIIKNKIPNVVIGCRDTFVSVNGKGIEKLKAAGVNVIEGIMQQECIDLNKRFNTRVKKQRPYIILKWAETQNGLFAPSGKEQKWITSAPARQLVHRWRSEEDSVLVGKNTAISDNPQLNTRYWSGKSPIRIVIDRNLALPKTLHLFDQSQQTIVFNSLESRFDGKVKYLEVENFDLLPQLICYQLYLMDIQSLIVEGGAETLKLFISSGLWDEARVFRGPQIWDEGMPAPILTGSMVESVSVGPDSLTIWNNN